MLESVRQDPIMEPRKPRVFFCFTGEDRALAAALRDGLAPFIDAMQPDTLSSSGSIRDVRTLQFANTDVVLLLATQSARGSGLVAAELRHAIQDDKPIAIIRVNETELTGWRPIDDTLIEYPTLALELTPSGEIPPAFIEQLSFVIATQFANAVSIRSQRPPDKLTRISGIGPLMERKLNAAGVRRYEEIAAWNATDVKRFTEALGFNDDFSRTPDRIDRENWIEQANILAHGGQTAFSMKVDSAGDAASLVREYATYLSFASRDRATVADLRKLLPSSLRLSDSDGLRLSANYRDEVTAKIAMCDVVLLALSEASLGSTYSTHERQEAWRLGKPIVPILVSGLRPDQVPPQLSHLQLTSFDPETAERDVEAIVGAILAAMARKAEDDARQSARESAQDSNPPAQSSAPDDPDAAAYAVGLSSAQVETASLEYSVQSLVDLGNKITLEAETRLYSWLYSQPKSMVEIALLQDAGPEAFRKSLVDYLTALSGGVGVGVADKVAGVVIGRTFENWPIDALENKFAGWWQRRGDVWKADIETRRAQAQFAAERAKFDDEQRRRLDETIKLADLQQVLERSHAVASMKDTLGRIVGTGFLINAADLGSGFDRASSYLLTSALIVWDPGKSASMPPGALSPDAVSIIFPSQSGHGAPIEFRCARVIWQSPPSALDAVLIELNQRSSYAAPPPIIARQANLASESAAPGKGARLALLGFPATGDLTLSQAGAAVSDTSVLISKGPRGAKPGPEFLHYRLPATAGQSGGPIFEVAGWTVVGMHHSGDDAGPGRPNLNGKPGFTLASEGVFIHSIIDAVERQFDFVLRARAWVKSGRSRSTLLSKAKLKSADASLASEPLSPWMAGEVAPYLAASRSAHAQSRAARLRAMAASVAVLPIIAAAAVQWWISSVSVALAPPSQIFPSRISAFLDPFVDPPATPGQQVRSIMRSMFVPDLAHDSTIRDLVLSSDGKLAAVLDASDTVRVWDLNTRTMVRKFDHLAAPTYWQGVGFRHGSDGDVIWVFGIGDAKPTDNGKVALELDPKTGGARPIDGAELRRLEGQVRGGRQYVLPAMMSPSNTTAGSVTVQEQLAPSALSSQSAVQIARRFSRGSIGSEPLELGGSRSGEVRAGATSAEPSRFHNASVRAVALSVNGEIGASAAEDGTLMLLRLGSNKDGPDNQPKRTAGVTHLGPEPAFDATSIRNFTGNWKKIIQADLSSDGRRLLTITDDGTAHIWDSHTGKLVCSAKNAGTAGSAAFSPDATRFVTTFQIWEATTCRQTAVLSGHVATAARSTFSSDSTRIVTATLDKSAIVWDVATGHSLMEFGGPSQEVLEAIFSPDGSSIAAATFGGSIAIWDLTTKQPRGQFVHPGINTFAFSPDGKTFVTASANKVQTWDIATGSVVAALNSGTSKFISAAFSPDSTRVVTASAKTVTIWDVRTGKLLWSIDFGASTAKFSPDGRMILTASGDRTARLWDAETGRQLSVFTAGEKIIAADFAPGGESVVIADFDKATIIPVTRPACGGPCSSAEFAADGFLLLTAGWGGKAQLWARTGVLPEPSAGAATDAPEPMRQIAEMDHGAAINQAIWLGKIGLIGDPASAATPPNVITAGDDGTAKVWAAPPTIELNPTTARPWLNTATIRGHDAPISHAAVTPDGRYLVTGDLRGAIRVTDLSNAAALSQIDPTPAYQRSIAPVLARGEAIIAGWTTAVQSRLAAWSPSPAPAKPVPVPPPPQSSTPAPTTKSASPAPAPAPASPPPPLEPTAKPAPPEAIASAGTPRAGNLTDDQVAALISDEARDMVIGFEVVSAKVYQSKYLHPVASVGATGINIGIGYDLGYTSAQDIRRDWQGLLPEGDLVQLSKASGLLSAAAREAVGSYREITVPWEAALEVFQRTTMPRFGRKVLAAFPNAQELKGHAFGALFSLVYNRGDQLDGEARREMRNIRDHLIAREFEKIPAELRAMKRLWADQPGLRGLLVRREQEAVMFERGLVNMGRTLLPRPPEPSADQAPASSSKSPAAPSKSPTRGIPTPALKN